MLGFLAQEFDRGIARMGKDVADEVLVGRAQQGDKNAFGLLVRKYQYRVTKLVSRYVSDSEAMDVAQEAFIKAWRALGGFRGNSAFYTWLYRISINTAKNHLVARGRRPANQDIDVAEAELYGHTERLSHSDTPEALLLGEEVHNTVLHAINDLPADLRTAILLREIEGLSYEEIAEAMECPIGTVRSRIFRARAAIEETLRPLSN
jgi:RNA polymerase sigma-70 factor (ECF subfamily)